MKDYKRLTKRAGWHKDIDLKDELGYSYIYQRLAELENAIEDGEIVRLPCKVGTVVYRVIYIDFNCGIYKTGYNIHETEFSLSIFEDMLKNKFPYTFLTKAEAEKKLEELKNENTRKQQDKV